MPEVSLNGKSNRKMIGIVRVSKNKKIFTHVPPFFNKYKESMDLTPDRGTRDPQPVVYEHTRPRRYSRHTVAPSRKLSPHV